MTLYVDKVYRILGNFVLLLALPNRILQVLHLALKIALHQRLGDEHYYHRTAHHREDVARLPQQIYVERFEGVIPVRTDVAEVDVLHRTENYRYHQHKQRYRHHAKVYATVGKSPEYSAYERKIRDGGRRYEEGVVHKAVVKRKIIAPAVKQMVLLARAVEYEKELIYKVLRGVSKRTAEQHRLVVFGKAQLCVQRGYGKQHKIQRYAPRISTADIVIDEGYSQGNYRNRRQSAEKFCRKLLCAGIAEHYKHIKDVKFQQKLQNDAGVYGKYLLRHDLPPCPAYQFASSDKKAARRGRLICNVTSPTCTSEPFTPTTNLGLTR